MSCDHDWQPVSRWSGRYRCAVCAAFGYRGIVTPVSGASAIRPYRCYVKGCSNPGIGKVGKARRWRCAAHQPKTEETPDD